MNDISIRPEAHGDEEAIGEITYAAFLNHPQHEPGAPPTEHKIVEKLRDAGALTLSLVCEEQEEITGHIALSPVLIDNRECGWYGLGPVSVRPDRQGKGIGSALIRTLVDRMREKGAAGIALVGEPAYYARFGFAPCPTLVLEGVPAEYFMCLPLKGAVPAGVVRFHPAFEAQ